MQPMNSRLKGKKLQNNNLLEHVTKAKFYDGQQD